MLRFTLIVIATAFNFTAVEAQTPDTVFLEELTWIEVRDAIAAGTTTIIVPTAGIEQNGPHIAIGKHKYRMNAGSERIARKLGNTLVAPVISFVPEGSIDPPSGHMKYAGSISMPEEIFEGILEYSARSLKVHGFTDILFVGDSGGNQSGMKNVAQALNEEWAGDETRVHFVSAWYTSTAFEDWLRSQGKSDDVIGTHAGLSDTTTLMAVAPQHVRTEFMLEERSKNANGVSGDPSGSSIDLGEIGMTFLVDAAMIQIEELLAR